MKINEIIASSPPSILYHYTSQEGLYGILESKKLWATKAHYLNDSKEFKYAIELLNEVLSSHEYEDNEDAQELRDLIESIETVNVCVTSFTMNGNLLSQWRGYGSDGAGYSLGINGAYLKTIATRQQFILVPVIYKHKDQLLIIRELIELWLKGERKINGLFDAVGEDESFEDYFAMIAPILKDGSFEEEQEWRLISPILSCTKEPFGFRPGKYSFIPYYRFSLEIEKGKFSPAKIIVGPSPMQDLSHDALRLYLISKGLYSAGSIVEKSQVPYRAW